METTPNFEFLKIWHTTQLIFNTTSTSTTETKTKQKQLNACCFLFGWVGYIINNKRAILRPVSIVV